jgi:general secretion pathway protein B
VTRVDTKADAKSKLPRVYALAELPEEVRSALPTLVISGGSYSTSPSQRLIIVNNQVFTESSQPAPGVVVERIEPTAVVLSFRGYSYRAGY